MFERIVFAGGGTRCLWQVGFFLEAGTALAPHPRAIAAASAGAAMACVVLAGGALPALERFKRMTAANRRNAYPGRLVRGGDVFPHYAMYREALLASIDAAALARLHAGPDVRIPVTRAPRWLGRRASWLLAGLADVLDHVAGPPVHARIAPRLGYRAEYASVRQCATPEALADLILASSCTPPFTPALLHGGQPALDAGVADNAPVDALADVPGPMLVLLARRYRALPVHADRVYVQPSEPLPVWSWDYTSPGGLQETFDIGRRDGRHFLEARRARSRPHRPAS
jgi:predicted acylesterase/phospholipase RssA